MLLGKLSPDIYAQTAEAVQAGHPSVKIFTTDITPSRKGRMVQHGDIWEVLKVLAKAGGIAAIHAEDNDIVMHMYEKLMREQRTGFENMAEVHNTLSEDLSFNRVIRLASNVEGAALYMMHTSAATGVRAIATARANGVPIYGETLHQYLMYNSEDYKKPNGQIYHTYPSLKFPADQQALWEATNHGAIQTVATDEICCPLRIKLQGRRIDDTTGGNAGVEPRVSLIYTETVEKRGYSLNDFVGLISTNAAKIMGLYPRKGALAVGSDADIVLLDARKRHIVRTAEMHEADYSPWEGRDLACLAVYDDAARQGRRRERRIEGRPDRRTMPVAQSARRYPLPPGGLERLSKGFSKPLKRLGRACPGHGVQPPKSFCQFPTARRGIVSSDDPRNLSPAQSANDVLGPLAAIRDLIRKPGPSD